MVPLSPKLVQVLACLADARGELVTRELLLDRFWPDVNVTDNTLTRAIADIRQRPRGCPRRPGLYPDDGAARLPLRGPGRRGRRRRPTPGHAGTVAVSEAVAGLEPFVAWERGRTALESLSVTALPAAAEAFSRAVAGAPQYAPGFAGLANAHFFRYEATRVDNVPDLDALTAAVAAATRATELDPTMGEGWAALGHALVGGRAGRGRARGVAPGGRARAAQLAPPLPHGRVHLGRGTAAGGRARRGAAARLPRRPDAGRRWCSSPGSRSSSPPRRPPAAPRPRPRRPTTRSTPLPDCCGYAGLTAAARGDDTAALEDFPAEAALSRRTSTVYARECSVLAHEALGFTWLSRGDHEAARTAFEAAAAASPGHGRAMLGLAIAARRAADAAESVGAACVELERAGKHGERALLLAAAQAWAGRADDGLVVADQALTGSRPDSTGWSLPADPMFAPLRAAAGYARLAARLASRAS